MKRLFSPAVVVLNRLGYRAKFMTVLALASAVGLVMVGQLFIQLSNQIRSTEQEQRGIESYPSAIRVLTLMQQHRGLTAGLLGGSSQLAPKVDDKARALDAAVAEFDATVAGSAAGFGLEASWRGLKQQWVALRDGGRALGQAANFRSHTVMVEGMLSLILDLGDAANLSLDPEAASFNLIEPMLRSIPEATERLGRLRGKGTGIVARGQVDSADHDAMVAQLAELGVTARALDERVARAATATGSAEALERARVEVAGAIGEFRRTATMQIVDGQFSIAPAEFFAAGTGAIDVVLRHLNETFLPTVTGLLDARMKRLKQVRVAEVGIALAMLAFLGYLMMGMYFAIVSSVQQMTAAARQLAQGDYTTRIELDTRDELGEVARQFNAMTESLGGLVREIKQRAGELADAAQHLTGASATISDSSEHQSEAASSMAAAIEQMTVSIGEISRHAADAAARSEASGQLSDEGGALARRTVEEMERIAEVVGRSAEVIERLGAQSSEISNIVNTIREIADQTNLLALNAAIEAARAGESGRGFAVVADEVRKLAERTASATGEITGMVSAIQQGTEEAVETMSRGVERVRGGVELSGQSGQAMAQISDSAGQVVASVRDINLALKEQGSVSTEIARSVEEIARMAEENNASVHSTAATARRLQDVAVGLQDQVARFRV
ncbi:MAG: methyl-accepting chemotaxis protein [Rhodocyclaceae bacterium]|nr:methyl-accepting chemotaxis protein [Rhodocyclaceae bacterium]